MKSTDFFSKVKRLVLEAFSFKKYKKMKLVFAILVAVALLPLEITFVLSIGSLFIFVALFEVLQMPVKFLHNVLSEEGAKVKHGTQVIVYFFAWPIVFLYYICVSLLTLLIQLNYMISALIGYIVTLCGFKFHLSIYEESISIEDEIYPIADIKPLILIIAWGASVAVALIWMAIAAIYFAVNGVIAAVWIECIGIISVVSPIFEACAIVYVAIVFSKNVPYVEKPKAIEQKEEPTKEVPVEEASEEVKEDEE